MPWNPITDADVLAEFTTVEQNVLKSISGGANQLPGILTSVLNAARGAIIAGGNQVGPVGTIADQVREDVIALARWKWLTSYAALKSMQTEARKQAATDAQERLDKISTGKPKIELPTVAVATLAPVGAVALARPGIRVHPRQYNKIIGT